MYVYSFTFISSFRYIDVKCGHKVLKYIYSNCIVYAIKKKYFVAIFILGCIIHKEL